MNLPVTRAYSPIRREALLALIVPLDVGVRVGAGVDVGIGAGVDGGAGVGVNVGMGVGVAVGPTTVISMLARSP